MNSGKIGLTHNQRRAVCVKAMPYGTHAASQLSHGYPLLFQVQVGKISPNLDWNMVRLHQAIKESVFL